MTTSRREFISAEEVCDCLRLDLATVYQLAKIGEIPGAIWGETLRFKWEEFEAWFDRYLYDCAEEALKQLEEEGIMMSYVDSEGERRYVLTTRGTLH